MLHNSYPFVNLVESQPTARKPSASSLEPHPPPTEHQPPPVEPQLPAGVDNNASAVVKDGMLLLWLQLFSKVLYYSIPLLSVYFYINYIYICSRFVDR